MKKKNTFQQQTFTYKNVEQGKKIQQTSTSINPCKNLYFSSVSSNVHI